jgi:hypothetical protein
MTLIRPVKGVVRTLEQGATQFACAVTEAQPTLIVNAPTPFRRIEAMDARSFSATTAARAAVCA